MKPLLAPPAGRVQNSGLEASQARDAVACEYDTATAALKKFRRVGELSISHLQERRQSMLCCTCTAHNVAYQPTLFGKCISNERTMTAPRHGFSAHNRCGRRTCDFYKSFQPLRKSRLSHVVCIPSERSITPPEVCRIFSCMA